MGKVKGVGVCVGVGVSVFEGVEVALAVAVAVAVAVGDAVVGVGVALRAALATAVDVFVGAQMIVGGLLLTPALSAIGEGVAMGLAFSPVARFHVMYANRMTIVAASVKPTYCGIRRCNARCHKEIICADSDSRRISANNSATRSSAAWRA